MWWILVLLKLRTKLKTPLMLIGLFISLTVVGSFFNSYVKLKTENEKYKEVIRKISAENEKNSKELKTCYKKVELLMQEINKVRFKFIKCKKEMLDNITLFEKEKGKIILK